MNSLQAPRLYCAIVALAAMVAFSHSTYAKLVLRDLDDPTNLNPVVSVGDTVPLVIMEDTDYRIRAARMGCHVWCVDSRLSPQNVSPPSKDGNSSFSDVILDGDTPPPSDQTDISFTETIADPDLWDTGGPRDLAIINFDAIAPGAVSPTIHSITAYDDAGNPIVLDFDNSNSLSITVVPEPAAVGMIALAGLVMRKRRLS